MKVLIQETDNAREGTLGTPRRTTQAIKDIADETLRDSLASLTSQLGGLLTDIKQVGEYQLKEVEMGLEISAEGGFALVGKAGVKGAIRLTFSSK